METTGRVRAATVASRAAVIVVGLIVAGLGASACGRDSAPASASREAAPSASTPQPAAPPAAEPAPTAPPARAASSPRIVFLGDSLTAGYGLEKSQAVPALIQARLTREGYHFEVVNAGVSGDTSAGGLSRLDWSLEGDVRVLVLALGANDGLRGLPIDSMKHNLEEIITRARARGIAVLLVGMEALPNYGSLYTAEFRETFPALARAHKLALMPFYLDGVAGKPELNIADGIHPNPKGAAIVADNLWRTLEPLLTAAASPAAASGSR
jgi:acyl-CoA thioesterase I